MLATIALCAVVADYNSLRHSYLPGDGWTALLHAGSFSEALLAAADGDQTAAVVALADADRRVLSLSGEAFVAQAAECEEQFHYLAD